MRHERTATDAMEERPEKERGRKLTAHASVWVLMGFVLWIGFFIGAIILHAMAK